jgi:hypothetical protein
MDAQDFVIHPADRSTRRALPAILGIGLVAGTLDISDALIFVAFHGVTPAAVFRYIASGLIGSQAASTGFAPVMLGFVLHYTIALSWTALFYLASLRLPALRRRPILAGVGYGALVYLVMNFVVVPLSRVPPSTVASSLASRVNGVLAVVVCIGLTISLLTRWRLGAPPNQSTVIHARRLSSQSSTAAGIHHRS